MLPTRRPGDEAGQGIKDKLITIITMTLIIIIIFIIIIITTTTTTTIN